MAILWQVGRLYDREYVGKVNGCVIGEVDSNNWDHNDPGIFVNDAKRITLLF